VGLGLVVVIRCLLCPAAFIGGVAQVDLLQTGMVVGGCVIDVGAPITATTATTTTTGMGVFLHGLLHRVDSAEGGQWEGVGDWTAYLKEEGLVFERV